MVTELTIRILRTEAAAYTSLAIEQTLPYWTLSLVERGDVRLGGESRARDGWLMVHQPHARFRERAEVPGRHLFVFLEVGGVPALERLPETFPLREPEAYAAGFARLQQGDALASASLLTLAVEGFFASGFPPRPAPASGRFASIVALMRERAVTRAELAHEVGLDPGHFDRAFHSVYGERPMEMARRFRLDRLRRELLAGDVPLDALAARHGFSEASALIRFFVRLSGETPGTFRERAKRSIVGYIGSFDRGSEPGNLQG